MAEQSKVAIVTGASRGLGKAISAALGRTGARLVLVARDAAALREAAAEVGTPDVLIQDCDLSAPDAPGRVVAAAIERFGRIDVLVNNAGATKRGDFLALSDSDHLQGFGLKYHAMVRFCRAAWPHLRESRGAIVNISGIGALTPEAEFTIGGPVNSAIINFSKALSKYDGGEVRVNVVCPGHIETDRLRARIEAVAARDAVPLEAARETLRRSLGVPQFGTADDIADMVLYLCSAQARYINGANFVVDGGATPGT